MGILDIKILVITRKRIFRRVSFGTISKMYKNMESEDKKGIAKILRSTIFI